MPAWITWQRVVLVLLSLVVAVTAQLWLTGQTQTTFMLVSSVILGWAIKTPGDPAHAEKELDKAFLPLVLFGLVSFAVAGNACAHTGTFGWPTVVACAGDVNGLVGQITSIILNDGGAGNLSPAGKAALEQLGAKWGADAVLCVVDELIAEWNAPAATKSPERSAAAARAEGFMQSTGVRIIYSAK